MLTVSELRALLRAQNLRLTKRLGQHHLVDRRAIERIVAACELTPQDTVIEIGAGLGALTEPLAAQAARVVAFEIDRGICALLRQRLGSHPRIEIRCEDALTMRWQEAPGAVVVGAIPYHITSDIVVALAQAGRDIARAVLVLQREVAQRLTAKPGTKAYGRLSVLGQFAWEMRLAAAISRSAFFPPPAVDSACLVLRPHQVPPVPVANEARFFALVRAAFGQRRKTLVNCLGAIGISRQEAEQALQRITMRLDVRGEELTLGQFGALAEQLPAR